MNLNRIVQVYIEKYNYSSFKLNYFNIFLNFQYKKYK